MEMSGLTHATGKHRTGGRTGGKMGKPAGCTAGAHDRGRTEAAQACTSQKTGAAKAEKTDRGSNGGSACAWRRISGDCAFYIA